MSSLCSVPDLSTQFFSKPSLNSRLWRPLVSVRFCLLSSCRRSFKLTNALYIENISISKFTSRTIAESEEDPIAVLNERSRRDYRKRDANSPTPMDSKEAEKYIRLVKEQQQRGLQKLKGDRMVGEEEGASGFSYKVDPYTLRSGDYVVRKKVGIGRFVGIKFDMAKGSTELLSMCSSSMEMEWPSSRLNRSVFG